MSVNTESMFPVFALVFGLGYVERGGGLQPAVADTKPTSSGLHICAQQHLIPHSARLILKLLLVLKLTVSILTQATMQPDTDLHSHALVCHEWTSVFKAIHY